VGARRPVSAELLEFLAPFPDSVEAIVLRLRARVLSVMPRAHEVIWDSTNAVAIAFAPSERWRDGVCHVAAYAKHANLGFNDGASLADPMRVLEGTGARIRHVSFRSVDEVEQAAWLDEYLGNALAQAGLSRDMGDRGMTVRVAKGAKLRPT
jgi:hypothetical protein